MESSSAAANDENASAAPDAQPGGDAVPPDAASRPTTFRWKTGAAILALGLLLETAVWLAFSPDRTYQVFYSMPIVSGTPFFLLLWWMFLSGLPWRTRLKGLAAVAAVAAAFFASVRFDGFRGEMLPILSWRWTPSAQEKAAKYWETIEKGPESRVQSPEPAGDHQNRPAIGSATHHSPLTTHHSDWPRFRGPNQDGAVSDESLTTQHSTLATRHPDWHAHPPKLLWRHPVGAGWSSFAVVGNLAFTQEQRGGDECVVCYDFGTGEQVWLHADKALFSEAMGGEGPRATPTVFDSRVYALGATGILNCLDAQTGGRIWSTNILQDAGATNLNWGMSGSPLVVDDLVVVAPGGNRGNSVVAYDRHTGEKVWSAGSDPAGYAAPRLVSLHDVLQILVFNGMRLCSYDPATGRELWQSPEWTNPPKVNAALPIVVDGTSVFIGSGYATGSTLLDIGFNNDVWSVVQRWPAAGEKGILKLKFNDPVVKDGYIYGLDEGILACHQLATGNRQWKRGRYGYGQLLLVGDVLLIQAESGEVALVRASPERYEELSRFPALDGKTWNHPVLVRGRLLVRNAQEAACYEIEGLSD